MNLASVPGPVSSDFCAYVNVRRLQCWMKECEAWGTYSRNPCALLHVQQVYADACAAENRGRPCYYSQNGGSYGRRNVDGRNQVQLYLLF